MKNRVLNIINVKKSFGNKSVLNGVNLHLEGGHIYGLVGPNGSGKSVLLKIISGLMNYEGKIEYNDKIMDRNNAYKANIGACIEKPQFIETLTGLENLCFLAKIKGIVETNIIMEWMKVFDLFEARNKLVKNYSLGMKQKLFIIQAVMEDQNIILLDEVSNSLDQKSKKILFNIINKEKEKGKIIIYVNHNYDEVMRISDKVYEISEGKVVKCESTDLL